MAENNDKMAEQLSIRGSLDHSRDSELIEHAKMQRWKDDSLFIDRFGNYWFKTKYGYGKFQPA